MFAPEKNSARCEFKASELRFIEISDRDKAEWMKVKFMLNRFACSSRMQRRLRANIGLGDCYLL